ncbi:MAG: hypothetical protein JWO63_2231 [Frankiales bacterium]|nr:hypothetical protein [Frankiales bacterium]
MPGDGSTRSTELGAQLASSLLQSALLLLIVASIFTALSLWLRGGQPQAFQRLASSWVGSRPDEPHRHRMLRFGLGLFWLADGALQAQPRMPAGFVSEVLQPGIAGGPDWVASLVNPLATAWQRHPVTADSITVWLQIGIGLMILLTGWDGLLQRAALWLSIGWSLFIWVTGEFLGGLLQSGASWLTGAPGSVLVYALAAALLLRSRTAWERSVPIRTIRRAVGAILVLGAGLQAIPAEGNWSAGQLSEPFANALRVAQPSVLSRPIRSVGRLAAEHPTGFNAVLVALLLTVGVGLWVGRASVFVPLGVALCLLTWWLGQDFGVLGGLATDPNTGLPLALLLLCGAPVNVAAGSPQASDRTVGRVPRLPVTVGLASLGLTSLLLIPAILALSLLGPADAIAALADGGGVVALDDRSAPDFTLADQRGRPITLSAQHGKLVLLTFLDPVCSDECPIIANQLAAAIAALGPQAARTEIIAVDSNPVFHNVADVAAFTRSHGLDGLAEWHFVAGDAATLQRVLEEYDVTVSVPSVGMISHSEGIYFVSADGRRVAYLGDGADPKLNRSYSDLIAEEIRRELR